MGRLFWAMLLLAVSGIAHAQLKHYSLQDGTRALPKKLVVLPVQVRVSEISAGGIVELVPQLTEQASGLLSKATESAAGTRTDFALSALPVLSDEEKDQMEDFLSTFLVVGATAYQMARMGGPPWEHKRTHFDYTLGSGLEFIRTKTGADAAIVVVANDYVSSSGRKAMFALGLVLGVGIPMGQSEVAAAMVDLSSGDILWMDYRVGLKNLADPQSAPELMGELLGRYPQAAN
jgi:hypothetical protein